MIALASALVSVISGCGGGGGGASSSGGNSAPTFTSLTTTKTVLLSDNTDSVTITAAASDPDGDSITYTGTSTGGTLTKTTSNKFSFRTDEPGEFTITITAADTRGGSVQKTATITSFGASTEEGGAQGTVTVPRSSYRGAEISGRTESGNILESTVFISAEYGSGRDMSRAVMFENKGAMVTTCEGSNFIAGELIVKMKSGFDLSRFADDKGLRIVNDNASGISLLEIAGAGPDRQLTVDTCEALNGDPRVEFVELNKVSKRMSMTANDTYFSSQWNLNLINVPQAWSTTTGSSSVIVAVLDTGIVFGHQDLSANIVSGYDFISSSSTSCDGGGIDGNPEDVADSRCTPRALPADSPDRSEYHGSHVAGIIAAVGNNGKGIAGINWNAKIMPVRVLGAGGGTDYDIIQGMLYAAGLSNDSHTIPAQKADIINMSLGGSPGEQCSALYEDTFNQVYNAGVLVFVATGNDGSDNGINPLALCDHAVAVAAVDRYSTRAWYSNAGAGVTIAAPGGDQTDAESDGILSSVRSDSNNISTAYVYMQGTSMATPHAAGVAALMLAANSGLTPAQIITYMTQTATDLGASGTDNIHGAGLINAYSAVRSAANQTAYGDPVLSVSTTKMYFGPEDISKTAVLTNTGGGTLAVSSISNSENTGGDWLSTSYDSGSKTLTATVSRTNLTAGAYTGAINIVSNGGNASIAVTLQVESALPTVDPSCVDSNIYIIAVDSSTEETASETSLSISGGGYSIFEIPEGSYYVIAGTDCDGDKFICDQSIDYCGIYPLVTDPDTLTVARQQFTSDINFSLTKSVFGDEAARAAGARLAASAFRRRR